MYNHSTMQSHVIHRIFEIMSELDNSPSPSRPRSIARFEFLAYLSPVLLICAIAATPEPSHDPETPEWQLVAPFVLIYVLVRTVLIFATARRRQNWAKWLYSALVVLDVVTALLAVLLTPYDQVFAPSDILLALFFLTEVAAVYFAFCRESSAWFHPHRLAAREIEY
jgi:hypothetical protein